MKQYSPSALKVLGLIAGFAASIQGPSALAEAVAKPSTSIIGQICETDAARLARAVFAQQMAPALGSRADCERRGVLAAPAQAHFAALASTPLTTARFAAPAPSPAVAGALAPPLATAVGFAPAETQPPARDIESAGLETYRSQGPISTFGHDDAPVGLKLGLAF